VSATLVRRGRSVSFVDTLVEADDVAVASAHFTFMAG
jgi:acyl-coenzyme A thioesterase PaaI-like protein